MRAVQLQLEIYMYVCAVYVCTYVRVYVCVYVCALYVCTYVRVYVCIYVCVCMYVCSPCRC
jgi:hypothetical protein